MLTASAFATKIAGGWGGRPRPRRTPGPALMFAKPTRASAADQGPAPHMKPQIQFIENSGGLGAPHQRDHACAPHQR
jgi:hypothetical protein